MAKSKKKKPEMTKVVVKKLLRPLTRLFRCKACKGLMKLTDDGSAYHHPPSQHRECKLMAPVPRRLGKCLSPEL